MSITFSIRKDREFLEPDINMSESNAWAVLRVLGYSDENYADALETPAQITEFIAKCDSVLASIQQFPDLDPGRAPEEGVGEKGARFVDFGMRPGYIMDRVAQLRALAFRALNEKGILGWG